MEKRRIGSLAASVIGVGCNNFGGRIDEKSTREVIDAAIDVGINIFDTADIYADGRSEELLGRFLGARRRDVIVATKFGNEMPGQGRGARPEYVRLALDASLKRLRTHRVVASVIAGATSAGQVKSNAAAAGWTLTPEDLEENPAGGKQMPQHL